MSKIARIQAAVEALARKLDQVIDPQTDDRAYREAALNLKDLRTTARLFETHGVQLALAEIDKYSGTTVNDLRVFMRKFNLTFGRAENPDERNLYPQLYESLQVQREKFAGMIRSPEKKSE
jgi:hypothetical protein